MYKTEPSADFATHFFPVWRSCPARPGGSSQEQNRRENTEDRRCSARLQTTWTTVLGLWSFAQSRGSGDRRGDGILRLETWTLWYSCIFGFVDALHDWVSLITLIYEYCTVFLKREFLEPRSFHLGEHSFPNILFKSRIFFENHRQAYMWVQYIAGYKK